MVRSESDVSDEPVTVSQGEDGAVRTWGTLQILEEVGSGGFGRVFRAWEPTLARDVALKIIRPRDPRPETLGAILREGQLLARIRHPNVVTIYGAQQIGDEIGLWMEFVRGKSLAQLVKEEGPRAAAEAAVIGVSVCQALAAVHQAGVLHRDIKAQNVMREAGGRIVLMDFGAGQMIEGPRPSHDGMVGTLPYMAPEVLGGARGTAPSDIYSMGVLLYFLVSGTYPVEGRRTTDFLLAHARSERRPLGDLRPDIPAEFVRVVEQATALNPHDRFATPGAMLRGLSRVATGEYVPDRLRTGNEITEEHQPPAPPKPRQAWWQIPAVALAAALGIWILGAVTSIAFNHTLGRTDYSGESIFDYWPWGYMALVAPTVKVTIVVLLWTLVRAVVKVLTHAARPAAEISESIRSTRHAVAARLGLDDGETAANALLAVQILAVGVFCWYFRDILGGAIAFVDSASEAELEPLRPQHLRRHQWYDFSMGLLILVMALGSRHLISMRRRFGGALHSSLVFSCVVLGAALVILVFPYRLLWHNKFEVATYNSARCYILGERDPTTLVYCPGDDAPRVREIPSADPALQRSSLFENIYTR